MKKASIFSREYERKIRRKRFAILFIILFFFLVLVYYIVNFSEFNNYVKNVYYSMITKENDENVDLNNKLNESVDLIGETKEQEHQENNNNESIDEVSLDYLKHEISLNNGEKINIFYEEGNQIEYIASQDELPKNYRFDISPSRSRILIEELNTQDTYMLDENLNLFKLDPEFFYSNSARTRFYKNDVVSSYENYSWYKNARFLNDNTIVYISNLPWFGKNEQYIWRTDIQDVNNITHFMTSVGGENIDFGELTEEGIKVNINNEMKLLTFSFFLN